MEVFSEQETVLLSDSMAHLPPEVLAKNFGVSQEAMEHLPKQELFIFQTDVPGSPGCRPEGGGGIAGEVAD